MRKDQQTVTPGGESVDKLPHGVSLKPIVTQVDPRGSLFEMFDERWDWNDNPLVYAYCFTIRPGIVKGWGYHEHHEDRYCIMYGEMLVVLYDERPDSPTRGLVSEIVMSHYNRCLLNIPAGIWHADCNIGNTDVITANFPTEPYDHENPDKYRLPIENDRIPYTFKFAKGGG
jgi:dTDP-4-dehydrorhamnose 3,5-epimerase